MPFDAESITTIIKQGMPALEVLAGSKAVALFIEKVSGALGWYTEPRQIIRKARAEAAASLIKAEADQEAKAINERIVARIVHEETKHQQNMEAITLSALAAITEDAKPSDVDDDWLSNFFDKGRHVSNEEMQKLWSQVLAGEANEPGSFSIRTVTFLSAMTKYDAELFRKFTSYVWEVDNIGAIAIIFRDMMWEECLPGISYGGLLYLNELGIIQIDDNKSGVLLEATGKGIAYNNRRAVVEAHQIIDTKRVGFPVGNIILSSIGKELFKICDTTADWSYYDGVIARWERDGHPVVRQQIE